MDLALLLDTVIMYKKYYSQFINANPDHIHMASHSHHYWPDCAIKAHNQYALDSVKMVDDKWSHFFSETLPATQNIISELLNFDRPRDISFASNTHELLYRLYSCIEKDSITILTSTDEFHSASRQFKRLAEKENVKVISIDLNTEEGKLQFLEKAKAQIDFIFVSHVFFNSGKILDWSFLEEINSHRNKDSLFCIDGYHSFCAYDLDISSLSDDVFYLSGGYKYAQAGEGMCFMTLPKNCNLRPQYTGWFASFESLESNSTEVSYSQDGLRFAGSTRDFSAHYRFNSVWEMFKSENVSLYQMTDHIKKLQKIFINSLSQDFQVLEPDTKKIGRFVTIIFKKSEKLHKVYKTLKENHIITDYRGNSLRFGFAPYLDQEDIDKVANLMNSLV
jgi:selenocysteine lyase/cysteine desulfurase